MSCRAALAVADVRTGAIADARAALEGIATSAAERQVVEAELAFADHEDARACQAYRAACVKENDYACRRERDLCGE